MKIKELPNNDRPREKMLSLGVATLSNSELLAVLIRTGNARRNAVELSQEIMASFDGSVAALADASVEALCAIPGIGLGKALTIVAAIELGRRFCGDEGNVKKVPVTSSEMVFNLMFPIMKGLDHEECWAIFLNRANYVISKEKISSGGINATIMDNRLLLRKALEKKASGIIIVHNHPSGNPKPGKDDIRMTERLKNCASPLDISLLDHVIFAGDRYFSFSDDKTTIIRK